MSRIIINVQTGQQEVVPLTPEEITAAEAAQLEERNDPVRLQMVADEEAKQYAKAAPVIQYLATHTPAECEAYVAAHANNLAEAKYLLGKFAIALCVLARR